MAKQRPSRSGLTSIRLNADVIPLLARLAEHLGLSQPDVVETLVRERAQRENLTLANGGPPVSTAERRAAARERFLALLEQAHRHDPGDLTPEELEREVTLADEEVREILRARGR